MAINDFKCWRVEWKAMPAFGNRYAISSDGVVRRIDNGYVMASILAGGGYLSVRLHYQGRFFPNIHHLVSVAFIGPRVDDLEVNHINGIKTDNRAENLEYVTSKENTHHAHRLGLCADGARHPRAKLSESDVAEIRTLCGLFRVVPTSLLDRLAKRYAVGQLTIRRMLMPLSKKTATYKHRFAITT